MLERNEIHFYRRLVNSTYLNIFFMEFYFLCDVLRDLWK